MGPCFIPPADIAVLLLEIYLCSGALRLNNLLALKALEKDLKLSMVIQIKMWNNRFASSNEWGMTTRSQRLKQFLIRSICSTYPYILDRITGGVVINNNVNAGSTTT